MSGRGTGKSHSSSGGFNNVASNALSSLNKEELRELSERSLSRADKRKVEKRLLKMEKK